MWRGTPFLIAGLKNKQNEEDSVLYHMAQIMISRKVTLCDSLAFHNMQSFYEQT